MYFDLLRRPDILIISRPKFDGGFGRHYGVDFQDGNVVHFTSSGRIEFTTPEGFACGEDVATERPVSGEKYLEIQERLRIALMNPRPYQLGVWNCETFANWLTDGKATSFQVLGVVALAAIAAVVAAAK
ncbi:MAG TPA: NC domain protein [Burkholderiales bacterium]|nr:NC domain protein [Burkholderiales bacterium]